MDKCFNSEFQGADTSNFNSEFQGADTSNFNSEFQGVSKVKVNAKYDESEEELTITGLEINLGE